MQRQRTEIHLAPLQGYTDLCYRLALFQTTGGIDKFYTPYFSVDRMEKDAFHMDSFEQPSILKQKTIMQFLFANHGELKELLKDKRFQNLQEVNLNLGCPYPMVMKKGRGAALLNNPERVNDALAFLKDQGIASVSVKVRSGIENETDLYRLLENLDFSCIQYVIVHPRMAKQMYKGKANVEVFQHCVEQFKEERFVYNGDIFSADDFKRLQTLMPEQKGWMIGRGILQNPVLPLQIKDSDQIGGCVLTYRLLQRLLELLLEDSSDEGHALNRMKQHLKMLLQGGVLEKSILKKMLKCKKTDDIQALIHTVC